MALYQMVIGSYTFQYNPQDIRDRLTVNNRRKTPLTGEISYIQRMGVTRDLSIKGMLLATSETDETELDSFRAAAMASAPLNLQIRTDRLYKIYPTSIEWSRRLGPQHKTIWYEVEIR